MNYGQSFRLAIKALATSKMRSLLTMLGIIIGVAAVIIILALGNGLTGMVQQQVDKLGVNMIMTYVWGRGDGSTSTLDPQDMYDLVEENPDVLSGVSPYVNAQATVRKGDEKFDKTSLYGVSEVMFNNSTKGTIDGGEKLGQGRFLSWLDVERRSQVCVIGSYLAENAFGGDALGQTLTINGQAYTVIGVLEQIRENMEEGGPDDQVYIPYENALEMLGTRNVTLYMFTSTSGETAAAARMVIDSMLLEYFDGDYDAFYTQTMAEQAEMINLMMGVAMGVLVAIAAISLLVGGIGIMNIMLVSVTERTREIGIRKSLGAKRRDIRRQFVIEAGTTSAIGGLLGIGLGCLLAMGLGALFGGMLSAQMGGAVFNATPTLGAIAISFGVSVGIGVLFGYLPANKAAKLNPIDALRYD